MSGLFGKESDGECSNVMGSAACLLASLCFSLLLLLIANVLVMSEPGCLLYRIDVKYPPSSV